MPNYTPTYADLWWHSQTIPSPPGGGDGWGQAKT